MLLSSGAASADEVAPRSDSPCAEASFTNVQLPSWAAIDEIRVVVAKSSPAQGAANISVEAGRFGRVVHVRGSGSRGLKFSSPLTGNRFHIALDPVFEARRSACIERILLLRGGALVASVQP
jgi:hypothetical protein